MVPSQKDSKLARDWQICRDIHVYWYNKVLSCQSLVKTPKREHGCCGSYDVSKRQATQHQLQKKLRAILKKKKIRVIPQPHTYENKNLKGSLIASW